MLKSKKGNERVAVGRGKLEDRPTQRNYHIACTYNDNNGGHEGN